MHGSLLTQLDGQRVKVVPQRDNLGWRARAEQRDSLSRNCRPRRSRFVEELALVFHDPIFFEYAESDSTVGRLETRPLGHVAILRGVLRPVARREPGNVRFSELKLWKTRIDMVFGIRSDQPGAACPLVLGAQDRDWNLGRIGVRRNAMVEQVFLGFLDLNVTSERCRDRPLNTLGPHLLDDLNHDLGEHHRRRDDGVPVARMSAWMRGSSRPSRTVFWYVLSGSPPVMLTRLPATPKAGMNLRNAASRSGGIAISVKLLSTQASDSSTPEPPAPA